ncbi:hypothetical protein [Burkholderia ubonensis]|uniref:hypothetical protein n=1 Tax=Burkholderia ubonensis TaxID=101571 RepID=UPI0012FB16D1|nr:hypothetical protein [Burkholderia ubonensis]
MSAGSTQQFTGLENCTRPAVRTGRKISKSGLSVNGRPAKILNENPPASRARQRRGMRPARMQTGAHPLGFSRPRPTRRRATRAPYGPDVNSRAPGDAEGDCTVPGSVVAPPASPPTDTPRCTSRLLSKDIEKTIGGLTLDPVFVRIVGHAGMPDYECGMCGQRTGVAS